ncbi:MULTISPECIES: hypothetical protein [Kitasatospora]|nr:MULTISPECIES: hypothetical protein [Kitasatospora]
MGAVLVVLAVVSVVAVVSVAEVVAVERGTKRMRTGVNRAW